ncbi:hypothetical protein ACFCZT_24505 [Streptomyces sp. NPDC056230]|uniref:hypothetical protein n=1 Tax=Streptomyces sp. NPDC056230 TaxID=3345754 RepID=UPI0035E0B94A
MRSRIVDQLAGSVVRRVLVDHAMGQPSPEPAVKPKLFVFSASSSTSPFIAARRAADNSAARFPRRARMLI